MALNGSQLGRVEMVLFVRESPRAAENMRCLCSGERGMDGSGRAVSLKVGGRRAEGEQIWKGAGGWVRLDLQSSRQAAL